MSINCDIFTNNNANVVIDMKKTVDLSIYSVTYSAVQVIACRSTSILKVMRLLLHLIDESFI